MLLARPRPSAAAWFVCQAFETLVQKTLHPFVDKAPADPDRGGDMGDRDPIGQE
jgi:hypothetical protein